MNRKLFPVASNSTDISGISGSPSSEYSFEVIFLGEGTGSESGHPLSLEDIWSRMRESALDSKRTLLVMVSYWKREVALMLC